MDGLAPELSSRAEPTVAPRDPTVRPAPAPASAVALGASRLVGRAGAWSRTRCIAATALLAVLCGAPWIEPRLVWCGWLGMAGALVLVTRFPWLPGLVCTFAWSALALTAAFYWAPALLAYTMQADLSWGLAVFVPLVLWEAARATLPFWLAARLGARAEAAWFPAALMAVILEAVVPTVFPWRMGYMQIAWPLTVQGVDLLGTGWATIIQFAHAGLLIGLAAAFLQAVRSRSVRPPLRHVLRSGAFWLVSANLVYGLAAMSYWSNQVERAPVLRVALVQEDPTYQGSADKMLQLTRDVCQRVDLVCWPESSGGTYEASLDRLSDPQRVFRLSRDPQRGLRPWPDPMCPLLLGTKTFRGDARRPEEFHQSATLLDRQERIAGRYDKRHLMPFGEYVPGEGWLPGIDRLFSVSEPVVPGREATVLDAGGGCRLGAMLCYEDMQPTAAQSLTNNSANLLVSLINGSAFDNPLTLTEHRLLAQLRAVECRRYLLRCAATGETCVISPLGQVVDRLPLQTPGVLTATVHLLDARTWACRLGDALAWLCAAALAAYVYQTRRQSPSGS